MAAKRSRDARRMKENQIALRAGFLEKEVSFLSRKFETATVGISLQLFILSFKWKKIGSLQLYLKDIYIYKAALINLSTFFSRRSVIKMHRSYALYKKEN